MSLIPPTNHDLAQPQNHDEDVLAMFLARKALRSKRTAHLYSRELARFRTAIHKPLATITLGDLMRVRRRPADGRRTAGAVAPDSQSLVITTLCSFFHFCHVLGYLPLNPAALLEAPRVPSTTDLRWCNAQEIETLLRAAEQVNPVAALLCPFLALTGLRIAEAASVCWSSLCTRPPGKHRPPCHRQGRQGPHGQDPQRSVATHPCGPPRSQPAHGPGWFRYPALPQPLEQAVQHALSALRLSRDGQAVRHQESCLAPLAASLQRHARARWRRPPCCAYSRISAMAPLQSPDTIYTWLQGSKKGPPTS